MRVATGTVVAGWWAENRPAAPGAVRKDLKAALDILLERPDIGSKVEGASSPNIRRSRARGFPANTQRERYRFAQTSKASSGDPKYSPDGKNASS